MWKFECLMWKEWIINLNIKIFLCNLWRRHIFLLVFPQSFARIFSNSGISWKGIVIFLRREIALKLLPKPALSVDMKQFLEFWKFSSLPNLQFALSFYWLTLIRVNTRQTNKRTCLIFWFSIYYTFSFESIQSIIAK